MPLDPIGRRAFLTATGGVVLGAIVTSPAALAATGTAKRKELSAATVSSDLYASPTPQRLGLVLYRGARPLAGPPLSVALVPPGAAKGTKVDAVDATLFKAGLPNGRGVYVVDALLTEPGVWNALAFVGKEQAALALQVNPASTAPVIGSLASHAPSPTKIDPLGVKPICTRHPACGLHKVSLANVIGSGTPAAVMFATPALCQTATCGPVLDELLDVKDRYEDRITFVHVEIYRSNRTTELTPTVETWQLETEPWLFTIDGSGVITGRLDGAFGRDEMLAELDRLVGP